MSDPLSAVCAAAVAFAVRALCAAAYSRGSDDDNVGGAGADMQSGVVVMRYRACRDAMLYIADTADAMIANPRHSNNGTLTDTPNDATNINTSNNATVVNRNNHDSNNTDTDPAHPTPTPTATQRVFNTLNALLPIDYPETETLLLPPPQYNNTPTPTPTPTPYTAAASGSGSAGAPAAPAPATAPAVTAVAAGSSGGTSGSELPLRQVCSAMDELVAMLYVVQ
jgi:hypothetical protein